MYNPFSLLSALKRKEFGDQWFQSGTPTFLVEVLKRNRYDLERLSREEATADLLGSLDAIDTNPVPLLYQSGYLTIKGYDSEFGTYRLGFPNQEVERGFNSFAHDPRKLYKIGVNFSSETRRIQNWKAVER
jgi:hypothetical protein